MNWHQVFQLSLANVSTLPCACKIFLQRLFRMTDLRCRTILPVCNIGSAEDSLRMWRKGMVKFSCYCLAVDILQCKASCCAGHPEKQLSAYHHEDSHWCSIFLTNKVRISQKQIPSQADLHSRFQIFISMWDIINRNQNFRRTQTTWCCFEEAPVHWGGQLIHNYHMLVNQLTEFH